MIQRLLRIYLVFCLAGVLHVAAAQAQTPGPVTQPVLTYVLDNAHRLRPLVGIVGAASIGDPVNLSFAVTQASVPAAHDYVLAITGGNNWPVLLQPQGSALTIAPDPFSSNADQSNCDVVDDGTAPARSRQQCSGFTIDPATVIDRVALSPGGSAAALLSSAQNTIYIFTNLGLSAVPAGQIDVSALGAISTFGISDDGRTVAIGVSDGQSGALFLVNASRQPRFIAPMSHPDAIAFMHNSGDAMVADDATNTIYSISGGQVFALASGDQGVSGPVGLGISNDNQRVFVANAQSGAVTTIALNGAATQPVYCNCTVKGLYPTNTDSVFRLTDFSGGSILLFDANRSTPRITFVPLRSSQF